MFVHVVTHEQYEQRKGRLAEQLRAGIGLLESAYQAQVRALDLVWMLQAEEAVAAAPVLQHDEPAAAAPMAPEPRPPDRPRRRGASEVDGDIREAFPSLPETFTRSDVCAALGYEPERGTLYRTLRDLVTGGYLRVEIRGEGKRATVYGKTGKVHSLKEA
jgi:hypothetical protein